MCGNFGLLQIGVPASPGNQSYVVSADDRGVERQSKHDLLDFSFHESLHEVSRLHGLRLPEDVDETFLPITSAHGAKKLNTRLLLSPLKILESQTASTEIRGGQAGGYSSLEYEGIITKDPTMKTRRVRLVARKRHALAADLAALYKKKGGRSPSDSATLTVIGHTRFATSSVNQVSGLRELERIPIEILLHFLFSIFFKNCSGFLMPIFLIRTPSTRVGTLSS